MWKVFLAEVQLIHVEQMSVYNFIILMKKETPLRVFSCEICETLKNSGGCFWKYVTCYYAIKNYVGHKVAIFNAALFTLLHLLLTWWWDMRLKHDVAWLLCAFIVNPMMRHETHAWRGMTLRGTSRSIAHEKQYFCKQ